MARIALVQIRQRHHHEHVGAFEIRVPGRFAANPGARTQIALDQRRHLRLVRRFHLVDGERQVRRDAVLARGHVLFGQRLVHGDGVMAAIGQADAGAADQVVAALAAHVLGQARPQQHDHAAAPVFRVDAGAARFDHAAAQVLQAAQVELVFRIQPADLGRLGRAQHAVGAHHFQSIGIAHDQVIAVRVEFVAVEAIGVRQRRQPHRLDKHLVTQTLDFAQFRRCGGLAQHQLDRPRLGFV